MSDKTGAGSLTALPVIETQAGDVSAALKTHACGMGSSPPAAAWRAA